MITYVVAIVIVALVFDFINGFHDSANSIATIVGTRVLSPFAAVVWAAFCLTMLMLAFTKGCQAPEVQAVHESMRRTLQ